MLGLFGGGNATIKVTLDPSRCQPGATIHAQVAVQADKDLTVREARVVLLYREEYQARYEEHRRDSQGHTSTHQVTSWQNNETEVQRFAIAVEGKIPGGPARTQDFTFAIPPDAPPSCWGTIVHRAWRIKATLDRQMAKDIEDQVDIVVFTPPPGGAAAAGPCGYSNEPEEAEMAFALPGLDWVLGEAVEGRLVVRPRKEIGISEARVELVRVERVPGEMSTGPEGVLSWLASTSSRRLLVNESQNVEKIKVGEKGKLLAGQEYTYPFRLALPSSGAVSCQRRGGSVRWLLKGILARSLRSDTQVEQEVAVYGGR